MKFKKLIVEITMMMVLSILTTSINAFAISPLVNGTRDPNGDGRISISDSVFIQQFLVCNQVPSCLEDMDVDEDGVITKMDADAIQCIDAGVPFSKGLAGSVTTYTDSSLNDISYYKFSRTNTSVAVYPYTSTYTLSNDLDNLSYSFENNNGLRSVGNNDERVVDWSKKGVVKLIGINDCMGTGFVIGTNTIVTAGHCVFNSSTTTAKDLVSVKLFDANGNCTLTATPISIHVPQNYSANTQTDYALIKVQEDLSDYMCFKMGVLMDYNSNVPISVKSTGFPTSVNSSPQAVNTLSEHEMYSDSGSILDTLNGKAFYNVCTSNGNSGSPVYYTESSNGSVYYSIVAIHTTGDLQNGQPYNSGVRITPELLRFFFQNENI